MHKTQVIKKALLVLAISLGVVGFVHSSGEEKARDDGDKTGLSPTFVEQPFSGKLITLLYQAVDLHKKEVSVSLEKYDVKILEDQDCYYIYFVDPKRHPGAIGIGEIPSYLVTASKETFQILSHSGLR